MLAATLPGCFGQGGIRPEDYVSDDDYSTWVVEVDYMEGHKPDQAVLDTVRARLAAVVSKDTVRFQLDEAVPARDRTWTVEALRDFSRDHLDLRTRGDTVVTHLLVLDGEFEVEGVLGVTIGHDLIAIFDATIDDATQPSCPIPTLCATPKRDIETAVYLHEFGHAIGLVDRGIDMVRDHEADECNGRPDDNHSSNPDSVMYCAVETTAGLALLTGSPPTQFDADDRQDLKAAGGK
jgi:hypothetical protein